LILIEKKYYNIISKKNKGTKNYVTVVDAYASCDYQLGSQTLQYAAKPGSAEIRLATNTIYLSYISIVNTCITLTQIKYVNNITYIEPFKHELVLRLLNN